MIEESTSDNPNTAWFVGAVYGGSEDQTNRFLSEGIWENGFDDKLLDVVQSMRPGERIAIKSSYTRKHGLSFDNRGRPVSVMAVKAIGTITENLNDGKTVKVDWKKLEPVREWYFFTHRSTIWRVEPSCWRKEALIAFAFNDESQDVERFRNDPYWIERYGTKSTGDERFQWADFYEEVAEKLLPFANDRAPLIEAIHDIGTRVPKFQILQDKQQDGSLEPLQDICPFTTMGIFNRTMTDDNRRTIALELAKYLKIEQEPPTSFEGVPLLNNQNSWFFSYAKTRGSTDIDNLWKLFVSASELVNNQESEYRDEFIRDYNKALKVRGVKWNLSQGLYWAHPWDFPTLDSQSRAYISKQLKLDIQSKGNKGAIDAESYLSLKGDLDECFRKQDYPVQSYPDLSLAAFDYADDVETDNSKINIEEISQKVNEDGGEFHISESITPYSIDDILTDGSFVEKSELENMLNRLRMKKNLVLQGPPGTGKTWLAKRLAYALIEQKDSQKVRSVQFHPNLSYEDFVRGWRPTGEGKLSLADGVFMEAIKAAKAEPSSQFVVVIEEINRGNPAQIFGELLTLLEAGKRKPSEALELCYPDADGRRRPVYVPKNLYVIGTMNLADRSLALVDLALRRRFAFIDLEPKLGAVWRKWVAEHCGLDPTLTKEIEERIVQLNKRVSADTRLGKQYQIGHSYVTPPDSAVIEDTKEWFQLVVETEIGPLLEEYWFDAPDDANKATNQLLQNW